MRNNTIFLSLLMSLILLACGSESKSEKQEDSIKKPEKKETVAVVDSIVNLIEKAHKKESFASKAAIQFDLQLTFGGKSKFDGTIIMTSNGDKIKMQNNTTTMIWDGKKAMITPDTANEKGARFALFTWSYFFAAPYKLSDPGTNHEYLGKQPLNGTSFETTKLTFGDNVGDSPNDWYMIYKDNETNLLAAMSYIVTAGGTSQEVAEEDPHAITYEAYTEIEGFLIATVWNFWTWNKEGEMQKLLGNANLSNIKFVELTEDLFKANNSSKPLS